MKKGFTLVELLAVIAILAILVIIALPNVLDLFNDVKKNTFQTEIKNLYNIAQQDFLTRGGKAAEYYKNNKNNKNNNELPLKGNKKNNYCIKIDDNGNIIKYYMVDDNYAFSYVSSEEYPSLAIEQIGKDGTQLIIKSEDNEQYNNINQALIEECEEPFWYESCISSSNNLNCKIITAQSPSSDETIDFAQISSDTNGNGLYYTSNLDLTEDYNQDGEGDRVYYYRGAVTNNNVRFGGYCWRVVRTNEDGSVRLRYNGTYSNGTCPVTGNSLGITFSSFANRNNENNEYIWEDGTGESDAKTTIDAWYTSSGLVNYAGQIANVPYCADKSNPIIPTTGNYTSRVFFGAANRLVDYSGTSLTVKSDAQPTYKCNRIIDKHTVAGDEWGGNGKLSKPIGLLTADEVAFAGGAYGINNTSYYLYINNYYWLISPFSSVSSGGSSFYIASIKLGSAWSYVSDPMGQNYLLPVISLKAETIVNAQGTGTYTNPYVVN